LDKEDIIKNYEDILRKYNILNQISKTVASTLDLNRILHIILTGVTFGNGFGFNRAFLFLIDHNEKNLIGKMAIGPATEEEAWQIWGSIQQKNSSLEEFLNSEDFIKNLESEILNERFRNIKISLENQKILLQCLNDGLPRRVDLTLKNNQFQSQFQSQPKPAAQFQNDFISDSAQIEDELLNLIDYPKFCIIPLISRTKKVGIMIVDNKFNKREITKDDINYLLMLSQFAASSIRNTVIYNDLKDSLSALSQLNVKLTDLNTKLSYLKEYNEKIIESIPISIIVIDNNFEVTLCNENCSGIMKVDKSRIIGKKIDTHKIYLDGGIDLVSEIKRVMNDKKQKVFYKVAISFEDHASDDIFDVVIAPLKITEENPEGVVLVIENITETVKLQKAINDLKRFSELGQLSATVAHEIRNPLIVIGGYANRIKKRLNEGKKIDSRNLDLIINEIRRLEKIVYDILDYAADKEIEFARVDLSLLLSECIDFAEISSERNNISITIECGMEFIEQEKMYMYGSYDKLKQAFINVLNNAIEASHTNDLVKFYINRVKDEGEDWVYLKVNNKAVLANKDDIYNIFLPFYTTKLKGTGLGLTITKRIIEQHSGIIEAESSQEHGTTFIIKLPLIN